MGIRIAFKKERGRDCKKKGKIESKDKDFGQRKIWGKKRELNVRKVVVTVIFKKCFNKVSVNYLLRAGESAFARTQ